MQPKNYALYHKLINEKSNKTAFQNTPGDPEYIELVHSGEDYFLRLKNLIENAQKEIHRLITEVYESLAFTVIHVPVLSAEERVDYILKNL